MRVLVTGTAGYIGSRLTVRLQRQGWRVEALDPCAVPSAIGELPGLRAVRGSTRDPAAAARVVRGMDAVVHLGWAFDEPGRDAVHANLLSTANLLEASLAEGVERFLFASSAVVYGPTGDRRATEQDALRPETTAIGGRFYAATKRRCEQYCSDYRRRGLPATVLRLHGVFGSGRLGQFAAMIDAARCGRALEPIEQAGGEYVHLSDVLDVMALCLEAPAARAETFNVAGAYTYSDARLARLIRQRVGRCEVRPIDDPTQAMVSVSIDKLREVLGYTPRHADFLPSLIDAELESRGRPADSDP